MRHELCRVWLKPIQRKKKKPGLFDTREYARRTLDHLAGETTMPPPAKCPWDYGSLPHLDMMWARLPSAQNAKKSGARLNTLIKRCVGFHPNRKWTLRLQASSKFKTELVGKLLKALVMKCIKPEFTASTAGSAIRDMALKNITVALGKRATIADMTHNAIKMAKRFDKNAPFKCTCGKCNQGHPMVVKGVLQHRQT